MARPRSEPAPAPPSGPLPLQRHCNSCGPSYCNGSIALRISVPTGQVLESRGARHLSNAQSDIFDMRQIILALALLYPAAALAQGTSQGTAKDAAPPAATYSARSASPGLTRVMRRAGIITATTVTESTRPSETASTRGSVAFTS